MFVTADGEDIASNVSERHKITYISRNGKGKEMKKEKD